MTTDKSRYELHFHGCVPDAVAVDDHKITPIFEHRLTSSDCVYQLPQKLADFTGRQGECDRIIAQLRQATITVVTGIAGVGKSALAVHVADQLQSDFPDAQLYVNLRGTEGQPVAPSDVLAGFLRVWGVDDQSLPRSLTERAELYRSVIADKRVLIVLDNARDQFQVRPLLPGSGSCGVIITSRRSLSSLEEASILNLEAMSELEARSLLEKRIGVERTQAEPEAIREITNFCDRLPLALRITSGILSQAPELKLADYASKLRYERKRLLQMRFSDVDVRGSLVLSYQGLETLPARLFRLLGLLVGQTFEPDVAIALLESQPTIAYHSFHSLVERQLIEPASGGRYRFHDLVRLFARGQLAQEEPAEVRQASRLRLCRWYLETSGILDLALNPQTRRQLVLGLVKGKDYNHQASDRHLLLTALNWFELERSHLLASVEWAYQAEDWELIIPLARNLVNFFNTYAYWADWERTNGLALEASRELGNRQGEAETLINLGNVYSLESNWEKASNCYEQSLGIFRELCDRSGIAKTLSNLGNVYFQQSYSQPAIDCYQESLAIFEELKDRYRAGQTLANMGILSAQQQDSHQAIIFWQNSLTKLHPDLPKSKRVLEWLQSIQGQTLTPSPPTRQLQHQGQIWYMVGGFLVLIVLIFSLLMLI